MLAEIRESRAYKLLGDISLIHWIIGVTPGLVSGVLAVTHGKSLEDVILYFTVASAATLIAFHYGIVLWNKLKSSGASLISTVAVRRSSYVWLPVAALALLTTFYFIFRHTPSPQTATQNSQPQPIGPISPPLPQAPGNPVTSTNPIPEESKKPGAMKRKPEKLAQESHPPTQTAPGGINIGRDNNGTATVNNFAPLQRRLTPSQTEALNHLAEGLPQDFSDPAKDRLIVVAVNEAEPIKYAMEIQQIFQTYGKTRELTRGLSWRGAVPEGVQVLVHSADDDVYRTAQLIVSTMATAGIPIHDFASVDFVKPGHIQVRIGVRPEN
jgi:hypothetical protein